MRSARPALSGPWHVLWHAIIVAFGWSLFGGLWWLVLLQETYPLANLFWLLGGAVVLLPAITLYWVIHNRGIYARKGPRRQVQVAATAYTHDWSGRPVIASFDQLGHARHIVIRGSASEKVFLSGDALPQAEAA